MRMYDRPPGARSVEWEGLMECLEDKDRPGSRFIKRRYEVTASVDVPGNRLVLGSPLQTVNVGIRTRDLVEQSWRFSTDKWGAWMDLC